MSRRRPARLERDEKGRRRIVIDSRVFLGVLLTISLASNAIFGVGAAVFLVDRDGRRAELNDLACAIRADAATSAAVASERGLSGDPKIVSSKDDLARAALKVAGRCPAPPPTGGTK